MSNGKIIISKMNLMGFTAETQVYYIENGGGAGVYEFLSSHRKYFDHSLMMGRTYNTLIAGRIEKFKEYAKSKGFEIEVGVSK